MKKFKRLTIFLILTSTSALFCYNSVNINLLSPGYSFSQIEVNGTNGNKAKTISHGTDTEILSVGFQHKLIEAFGDFTFRLYKTEISKKQDVTNSYKVSMVHSAVTPGFGCNLYLINDPRPFLLYVGFHTQLNILQFTESINLDPVRYMGVIGVKYPRKKSEGGHTLGLEMFFGPSDIKGKIGNLKIPKQFVFGINIKMLSFINHID